MVRLPLLLAFVFAGIPSSFDARGLVSVETRLNGRGPFRLLVDTGATTTLLDDSVASMLALTPSRRVELVTTGGTSMADAGILAHLSVGAFTAEGLEVSWRPLEQLRQVRRDVVGVLGQDVLSRATLTIDYGTRHVRLERDAPCQPGDARTTVTWLHGRPSIAAGVQAPSLPRAARLVVDSAATALLLFGSWSPGDAALLHSHDGASHAAWLPPVDVGVAGVWASVPAARVDVADRPEHGLLPTATYKRVCMDGPRSEMVIVAW